MHDEKYTAPNVEQSRPGADEGFGRRRQAMVWDEPRGDPSGGRRPARPGQRETFPDRTRLPWTPDDRQEAWDG